ncbi:MULTISPECIES: SMR family transporter [Cysteiniphilum]|uniref:SMR family transporter n=1 Tax=Cysteiniphilum TaxID=2056696 RepID=UPI0017834A21|nr:MULTISPECIES: SMR family transporter [Cysteiniphilum]
MDSFLNLAFGLVVVAALIDVVANLMIAKSKGFQRKAWGISAIVLVLLSFTILAQAVKSIDLAIAYASWGAIGIIGTAIGGMILFKDKLKPIGWFGIVLVIIAIIMMKL